MLLCRLVNVCYDKNEQMCSLARRIDNRERYLLGLNMVCFKIKSPIIGKKALVIL